MRITFLSPYPNFSGGERVIAIYAHLLSQRGHQVNIVCQSMFRRSWRTRLRDWRRRENNNHDGSCGSHYRTYGVPHTVLSSVVGTQVEELPDADVLIATFWPTAAAMVKMPASKGVPVYLVQGDEGSIFNHRPDVEATYRLEMLQICVSQWLLQQIQNRHPQGRRVVIHNAVEHEKFPRVQGLEGRDRQFGFIFSQASIKGADLAIEALRRARIQDTAIQAVALVPGSAMHLPDWINRYEQPDAQKIAATYGACRAWICPSRNEGFGLPILESMACGTPVIGTPTGVAPELIGSGGGLLVPHDDVEALTQAILKMCRMSEPQWLAMSERAWEIASPHTWEAAADQLEQVLSEEVRLHRRP